MKRKFIVYFQILDNDTVHIIYFKGAKQQPLEELA
jgi:hypothetical protein